MLEGNLSSAQRSASHLHISICLHDHLARVKVLKSLKTEGVILEETRVISAHILLVA